MESGFSTGNRWGLTGTEDIGNAKVGFVLESGFNSDDGASGQDGRLFGREAQVNVSGAYGTLYAGRIASVVSDSGSICYLGDVSAFPSAFGIVGNQAGSTGSAYARYDNTIAYQTPAFSGLQAAALYSFKADSKKDTTSRENSAAADRYAGAALRYKAGKAAVVLAGDYTLYSNTTYKDQDNGYSVILGGNYDFGAARSSPSPPTITRPTSPLNRCCSIAAEDDLAVTRAFRAGVLNCRRPSRLSAARFSPPLAIVMPRTWITAPPSSSVGMPLSATPTRSASAPAFTLLPATLRKRPTPMARSRPPLRLVSASSTSSNLVKETSRSSPFC